MRDDFSRGRLKLHKFVQIRQYAIALLGEAPDGNFLLRGRKDHILVVVRQDQQVPFVVRRVELLENCEKPDYEVRSVNRQALLGLAN